MDAIARTPSDRIADLLGRTHLIKSRGNYVLLCCGEEIVRVRSTLTAVVRLLDESAWLQIHRSVVVRKQNVTGVKRVKPNSTLLLVDTQAPLRVGRKYRRDVVAWIGDRG